MSDTTWDTDECERWIDNDYNLYEVVLAQGRWMDTDELARWLEADIDWRYFNSDIDTDEVDFEYLASQYIAAPAEKGPFD